MADLLDKDIKTTVLKMLEELKDDVKKVKKTMCEQNANNDKERENLKGNKKEILELKSTLTERENSLGGVQQQI